MNQPVEAATSKWRRLIRAAGLRSTHPRVEVLRRLEQSKSPLSHAELVQSLGRLGFDRATIFRNLNDLATAGLVVRRDLGDHTWRFELQSAPNVAQSSTEEHPHFTCTDCGTVTCLPLSTVQVTARRGLPKAVAQRRVRVTLQGLCDACDPPRTA